ncbi:co-translational protein [Paraglaciecola Antarctic GD virus 1]|nr:co-translational protein [Paraglaciecola Antarctic GD virus 1]
MKEVSIVIAGYTGSGKTAIFRLVEDALVKAGVTVNVCDSDAQIEERKAHELFFTIEGVNRLLADKFTVAITEMTLRRSSKS